MMRCRCSCVAVLSVCLILIGPAVSKAAPPKVTGGPSSDDNGVRKLSGDLQKRLLEGDDAPILVQIAIRPGAEVDQSALIAPLKSRVVAGSQWITAEASARNLARLAVSPDVRSVLSVESAQPVDLPASAVSSIASKEPDARSRALSLVVQGHDVPEAWDKGYLGEGVVTAICDTGVDFCHPDLAGSQARYQSGPYAGWPMSYWTVAGANYGRYNAVIRPDRTFYFGYELFAGTLPLPEHTSVNGNGELDLTWGYEKGTTVTVNLRFPLTSASGNYLYTTHPSLSLARGAKALGHAYAATDTLPAIVLVVDESSAGFYDTVYVDADFDGDLTDEKPMRKGDELAGADVLDAEGNPGQDGVWDLSAWMLAWISDGANHPPGVTAIYPNPYPSTPAQGRVIVFIGDGAGHGTSCASDVAGRGVTTDPYLAGGVNPNAAGGAEKGGLGTPVLTGMAPAVQIAAIQSGFSLAYDSIAFSTLGPDGAAETGDEPNIVNHSWGSSYLMMDSWNEFSRFMDNAIIQNAPRQTHLVSTGNGGHGYGTVTSPNGAASIGVGASTVFGSLAMVGHVPAEQMNWGNVIGWSNRGPGQNGRLQPAIVAAGAYAAAALPLNISVQEGGNGAAAYESFGGTSMACPVASGILSLVYESYMQAHGEFPTWQQARDMLMAGATDLGYDPLVQGAGNLNALRSVEIAAGERWSASPTVWEPGLNEGADAPAFAPVLMPGQSASQTFSFENASIEEPWDARAESLLKIHEDMTSVSIPSGPRNQYNEFLYLVSDISDAVRTYGPDLVRIKMRFPLSALEPEDDATTAAYIRVSLLDWTDHDGDGVLWTDADQDGYVSVGELDTDPETSAPEYLRLNYTTGNGNVLETSIGRDSLSRIHDGLFIALQRYASGFPDTEVVLQVSYFRRTPWDWVMVADTSNTEARFEATVTVPEGSGLTGLHEGVIRIGNGGTTQTVPVLVNVASPSTPFHFGADSLDQAESLRPYDNATLLGGIDWGWRPEQGDWRLYFFNVEEALATTGTTLLLDVQWQDPASDVDAFFLTPYHEDVYSQSLPAFFGPHGMLMWGSNFLTASSQAFGGVRYLPSTTTGGPREIISYPARAGFHGVVLHQVLTGGERFAEPFLGTVSSYTSLPLEHAVHGESGTLEQMFSTSWDINEPIVASTFGLSPVDLRTNETASQDTANDSRSASWVEKIEILDGGYLRARTTSAVSDLDIDLAIYRDEGNGIWDGVGGEEERLVVSAGLDSHETVLIVGPEDGTYFVTVHGYSVPNGSAPFDMEIAAVQGQQGLSLTSQPPASIAADEVTTLTFSYQRLGAGAYEGILFIGTEALPRLIAVGVMVGEDEPTPVPTETPEPTIVPTATPTPDEPPVSPTPTADCEGIECVVLHFYGEILDRNPSQGEVDAWSLGYFDWLIAQNVDVRFVPSEMGRQFFLSDEYQSRNTDAPSFVTDCYNAFLYRDPSQGELDGWGSPANRKETVSIFSRSEEFQNRIAGMFPDMEGSPTRNFVATMYLGLLDRLPDPGGLAFYADEFDAAVSERDRAKQMGREVSGSQEYAEKRNTVELRVESMYRAYLGRYPNNSEIEYWAGQLSTGDITLEGLIDAFAESQEFTNLLARYFDL